MKCSFDLRAALPAKSAEMLFRTSFHYGLITLRSFPLIKLLDAMKLRAHVYLAVQAMWRNLNCRKSIYEICFQEREAILLKSL